MKLEQLYKMAMAINEHSGESTKSEMTIILNESKHENLQEEVYRFMNNQTLQGYMSEPVFQIILFNTKYIFKIK